jgi:type VI secretion system protein ImpF
MSKFDSQMPLIPSLLDRLIDTEPDVSTEPLWSRSHTLSQLKESVRRDLENLLNTRQTRPDLFLKSGETARSILTYGVPDFTAQGLDATDEQQRLKEEIAQAIRLFEPRLIQVQVDVEETDSTFNRTIHLKINAVLCAEPVIESIVFDTIVETSSGVCEVQMES